MRIVEFLQEGNVVIPGDLCKCILHNFPVRPCGGERPHVLQVPGRQAVHIGEGFAKVGRKPVYNARPPPFAILTFKDRPPDIPIEQHHGRVRGHDRAQALLLDALLEVAQRLGIVAR